ncbi:MAG: AAA family ATPase [Candidatus Aenigmarchaeota archaeon]|nr:AAA family ATPase [Candidatus Aenigmarchaeota archaeon]
MPKFNELSKKQQRIIQSRHSEALILAGPGTGKTEMLAHRIVDILSNDPVEPDEILALTFSRKATFEMRTRLDEFEKIDTSDVNISTIHAESLRTYYQLGGSRRHILDDDEIKMVTKDALLDNGVSSGRNDIKCLIDYISQAKSNNILPQEVTSYNPEDEAFIELYENYESLLEYHNAMDFNDIILKPVRMLDSGNSLDRNIGHLLIDEFQDINSLEFNMMQKLGNNVEGLFIVGDDDQSIYGFRNANPNLIKSINSYYPSCYEDCLEETYRCSEHIIRGALEIVSKDENYEPKPIHSARGMGKPIKFLITRSEGSEANWIGQLIEEKIEEGYVEAKNIGILAKSLALAPVVIYELRRRGIDVTRHVSGGIFRHRAVRDIISVGRLMIDPSDNLAFRKCLTTNLASGIGDRGVEYLRDIAENRNLGYWDVVESIDSHRRSRRWRTPYRSFKYNIENLFSESMEMSNMDIMVMIAERIGVTGEEGVDELLEQVEQFGPSVPFNTVLATLQTNRGIDKANGGAEPELGDDSVSVMSMHASKGLTFDVVFLVGMDQKILPDTEQEINEQRRLCYVAMTRARSDLILCHTRKRTGTIARGVSFYNYSKFIEEIPKGHIEIIDET